MRLRASALALGLAAFALPATAQEGDDPFTPEREPSVPFSLSVVMKNAGYGLARNVRFSSEQPEKA